MSLKVAYNSQIHKLSKCPGDFAALSQVVNMFYRDQLPVRWAVQYVDCDGDAITVSDQHDYENLLDHIKESAGKTIKVTVVEIEHSLLNSHQISESQAANNVENVILKEVEPEVEEERVEEKIVQEAEPLKVERQETYEIIKPEEPEVQGPVEEKVEEERELREEPQAEVEEAPKSEESVKVNNGKFVHEKVKCDGCGKLPIEGIRYKCTVCANFDYCEDCEATTEHPHHFIKMRYSNNANKESSMNFIQKLMSKVKFEKGVPKMEEAIQKVQEAVAQIEEPAPMVEEVVPKVEEPEAEAEVEKVEPENQVNEAVEEVQAENAEDVENKEEEEAQPEENNNGSNSNRRKLSEVVSGFFSKVFEPSAQKKEAKSKLAQEILEKTDELNAIFVEADRAQLEELVTRYPHGTIEQLADAYMRTL